MGGESHNIGFYENLWAGYGASTGRENILH